MDQQLSYRELNTKANQLAHHFTFLLETGSETRIGTVLERTPPALRLSGSLGVWRWSIQPPDPNYPQKKNRRHASGC